MTKTSVIEKIENFDFRLWVISRTKKAIQLLGKKIRAIRKSKKLSQSQLAFEALIPRNQVVNIELEKVNTSISSILAIPKALQILVKELFEI